MWYKDEYFRRNMLLCMTSVMLTLLTLTAFLVLFKPKIESIYGHHYVVIAEDPMSISQKDEQYISYLLNRNRIIPISTVYENTLAYYDSIITILLGLFGLFALLSYFSFKRKIKEDLDEHFETYKSDMNEHLYNKFTEEITGGNVDLEDYIKHIVSEEVKRQWELKENETSDIIREQLTSEIKTDDIKSNGN